jgi:hypothetical protein
LPETKERFALRGALYKRWAVRDPARRRGHLKKAEAAYKDGAKLAGGSSYQRLNALALKFVLGSAVVRKDLKNTVDGYLDEAKQRFDKVDRDFWDVVEMPDVLLHKFLICGTLPSEVEEVVVGYIQARAAGPSLRQWASVKDHVLFLATMAEDSKLRCYNPEASAALRRVYLSLAAPHVSGVTAAFLSGGGNLSENLKL